MGCSMLSLLHVVLQVAQGAAEEKGSQKEGACRARGQASKELGGKSAVQQQLKLC